MRARMNDGVTPRKMLQAKAARGLHRYLRSVGRVPGAEATAAHKANAAARRALKAKELELGPSWRYGNTTQNG